MATRRVFRKTTVNVLPLIPERTPAEITTGTHAGRAPGRIPAVRTPVRGIKLQENCHFCV